MDPIIGAGIFKLGGALIDKLFPDPEQKAKATLAMAQLEQNGELEDLKVRMSAIVAEAQSADPWTSRARPSFLYVMYLLILACIPMGILSAFQPEIATRIAEGMGKWLSAIPEELWVAFGIGYTGYAYFRSNEKKQVLSKGRLGG